MGRLFVLMVVPLFLAQCNGTNRLPNQLSQSQEFLPDSVPPSLETEQSLSAIDDAYDEDLIRTIVKEMLEEEGCHRRRRHSD